MGREEGLVGESRKGQELLVEREGRRRVGGCCDNYTMV